jgi:hypothetical protein
VSQLTYYRWRREFGGLQLDQVKRLKDLELENQRLRKAVSDLTLDKLILAEAATELHTQTTKERTRNIRFWNMTALTWRNRQMSRRWPRFAWVLFDP